MAIRKEFGQAVIGTTLEDRDAVLMRLRDEEINLVSIYNPVPEIVQTYLAGLDIEKKWLSKRYSATIAAFNCVAGIAPDSPKNWDPERNPSLPQGSGYEALKKMIADSADAFAQATSCKKVHVEMNAEVKWKTEPYWHIDALNMRGLQVIDGETTLWLPDKWTTKIEDKLSHDYYLSALEGDKERNAQSFELQYLNIFKGERIPNALFHAKPAYPDFRPEPGRPRITLRFDMA